jgi:hypothetical protein
MKTLLLVYALSSGADAGSTHYALSQGATEVLLTQRHSANYAIIGAQATGVTYYLYRLHQAKPKAAKALTIALIAVKAFAVTNNIRVGQRSGR